MRLIGFGSISSMNPKWEFSFPLLFLFLFPFLGDSDFLKQGKIFGNCNFYDYYQGIQGFIGKGNMKAR